MSLLWWKTFVAKLGNINYAVDFWKIKSTETLAKDDKEIATFKTIAILVTATPLNVMQLNYPSLLLVKIAEVNNFKLLSSSLVLILSLVAENRRSCLTNKVILLY